MKTTAAILTAIGKPLEIQEIECPPLDTHQVLVKIEYAGICRSQINEIQGLKGEDRYIPHTLGHEGVGIIEQIGKNVTNVHVGDKVIISWLPATQNFNSGCVYTSTGLGVKINSGPVSTFMRHAVVSSSKVVKIPHEVPSKIAALFGCAIPTGMGMVLNQLDIEEKATLAIFGVGGIGMSALIAATTRHPKELIAIDVSDEKLSLAKKLGATKTINASTTSVTESIFEICPQGVDYSIEAVGKKESIETAFQIVRNLGGRCMIAGNPPVGTKIALDPFDFIKGKNIEGSWGGGGILDRDIPKYLNSLSSQFEILENLIGATGSLEEITSLIEKVEQGSCVRAIVKM